MRRLCTGWCGAGWQRIPLSLHGLMHRAGLWQAAAGPPIFSVRARREGASHLEAGTPKQGREAASWRPNSMRALAPCRSGRYSRACAEVRVKAAEQAELQSTIHRCEQIPCNPARRPRIKLPQRPAGRLRRSLSQPAGPGSDLSGSALLRARPRGCLSGWGRQQKRLLRRVGSRPAEPCVRPHGSRLKCRGARMP